MRCSQPSAIGVVAAKTAVRIGKTLFTINYIDEDFLVFPIRTDRRVNLWVALQDQCGTVVQ